MEKIEQETDQSVIYENVYDPDTGQVEEVLIEEDTLIKSKKPRTRGLNNGPHYCNLCSYATSRKHLLIAHSRVHSDERPHKCYLCEKAFKTSAALNSHVNTHTGTKPHPCKDCEKAFTTSRELLRHVRYKHTHEKRHKCSICEYACVEYSKLRRHIRTHTGERPYPCPHCPYAAPHDFGLKRHLRTHTGEKPFECHICKGRFTQSNSLKDHLKLHESGSKLMFQCTICETLVSREKDLQRHFQNFHVARDPIPCGRCDEKSIDRYHHKLHLKTHDGERYQCSTCNYTSGNFHSLENHMLIHGGESPFTCEICSEAYKSKHALRCHIKSKHDPEFKKQKPRKKENECNLCAKKFYHMSNLIKHMESHGISLDLTGNLGQKPFTILEVSRVGDTIQLKNEDSKVSLLNIKTEQDSPADFEEIEYEEEILDDPEMLVDDSDNAMEEPKLEFDEEIYEKQEVLDDADELVYYEELQPNEYIDESGNVFVYEQEQVEDEQESGSPEPSPETAEEDFDFVEYIYEDPEEETQELEIEDI